MTFEYEKLLLLKSPHNKVVSNIVAAKKTKNKSNIYVRAILR